MKTFKLLLFGFLSLTLLSRCQDVIDLELEDATRRLVVEGAVQSHVDTQFVKLSYTSDFFATTAPDYSELSDATIELYEDNSLTGKMNFNSKTEQFEIFHRPEIGSEYYIDITLPTGENYRSEPEELRFAGTIDSIYSEVDESNFFFQDAVQVLLSTVEVEGPGDAYQWKVFINGEYQGTGEDLFFINDDLIEGNTLNRAPVYLFTRDEYEQRIAEDEVIEVVVWQMGITRNYYRYIAQLADQSFVGGPFDTPPAELRSNVFNTANDRERALGFFFAADVDVSDTLFIK